MRLQHGLDCRERLFERGGTAADSHFSNHRALNTRQTGLLRTHRLNKIKTRLLWIVSAADTKCEVQSGLEIMGSEQAGLTGVKGTSRKQDSVSAAPLVEGGSPLSGPRLDHPQG